MKTIRLLSIAGLTLGASTLSAQTITADLETGSEGYFKNNAFSFLDNNSVNHNNVFGVIDINFSIAPEAPSTWGDFDFDAVYNWYLDGDIEFGNFFGPAGTPGSPAGSHTVSAEEIFLGQPALPFPGQHAAQTSLNAGIIPYVVSLYDSTWGAGNPTNTLSFYGGDVLFVFDTSNDPNDPFPGTLAGGFQIISFVDAATLEAQLFADYGKSWFQNGVNLGSDFTFDVDGKIHLTATPVPEPATIGMLGVGGLLGLAVVRRRFSKKAAK